VETHFELVVLNASNTIFNQAPDRRQCVAIQCVAALCVLLGKFEVLNSQIHTTFLKPYFGRLVKEYGFY
jgi:hypothetical protein